MTDFEKLGAFYLGRAVDPETRDTTPQPLLYDSRDLTTHAVILGMTGSGKTGLGVGLLEEAAIDGIPVIAIDPKGDLGNLLLTFPGLAPADFRPWIDESAAAREGRTPDEHARATAELWRKGLAKWDQGPDRIERFAGATDRCLYTPGSRAGVPVSVLSSFAPPKGLDEDARRESVRASVSGLLGLLGIDADPIRSREHILLSNLLERAWSEDRALDLATLIQQIQSPPIQRIGVLDVDSFYPAGDRFALAMTLTTLLASPGFEIWTEGTQLDAASLLYGPGGRPRMSIFSIAHLSDPERMFFVTRLLNELVSWVRSQSGSQGLRAILYMDEVFGYLPPTANPPSKLPMLTLLKQARASGLGVVLSTQNPVDLDYKALSNAGTWFLGRLQTERDKARVMDGLESAAVGASLDRATLNRTLSGLGPRRFLLNNIHEDGPVLFETRWALSYLAGPMTREQIKTLAAAHPLESATKSRAPSALGLAPPVATPAAEAPAPAKRPVVPPEIKEGFALVVKPAGPGERLIYRPCLAATVNLHYSNARARVDHWERVALWTQLHDDLPTNPWLEARELGSNLPELDAEPPEPQLELEVRFAELPAKAANPKAHTTWNKKLKTHLYRERPLQVLISKKPKLVSELGESEDAFLGRVRDALRAERDLKLAKLRKRYAPKLARLQDQIEQAEQRVAKEEQQYTDNKVQGAISIGTTLLGAFLGRKLASSRNVGRASTAMRGMSRAARQKGDIGRAEERVEQFQERLQELEDEFQDDLAALEQPVDVSEVTVDELRVNLRKADTDVERFLIVWTPWRIDRNGIAEPAFEV